jgi:hypothetical protein
VAISRLTTNQQPMLTSHQQEDLHVNAGHFDDYMETQNQCGRTPKKAGNSQDPAWDTDSETWTLGASRKIFLPIVSNGK